MQIHAKIKYLKLQKNWQDLCRENSCEILHIDASFRYLFSFCVLVFNYSQEFNYSGELEEFAISNNEFDLVLKFQCLRLNLKLMHKFNLQISIYNKY